MKATLLVGALCALTGCSHQTQSVHLTSLPLSKITDVNAQWSPLSRNESRYPKEAILAEKMGCTSLEYVINEAGRAEQIRVLARSDDAFSEAAMETLQQWQWQATAANPGHLPVKSQTRFEFCIEHNGQPCDTSGLAQLCQGEDMVRSTGQVYTQV
ncbi:energy transducer TonB [Aeromonas bestiarum]|uniref:energy transducer TonB n=1 Tax=Aeromonas bestiarum TaxID=105751 RepID=UPI00259E8581|nr:energy transducer TonB [Aeromonas bestiarum]MDM5090156.1 energy transducer TonB [Aeromonas bestiarum]